MIFLFNAPPPEAWFLAHGHQAKLTAANPGSRTGHWLAIRAADDLTVQPYFQQEYQQACLLYGAHDAPAWEALPRGSILALRRLASAERATGHRHAGTAYDWTLGEGVVLPQPLRMYPHGPRGLPLAGEDLARLRAALTGLVLPAELAAVLMEAA